MPQRDRDDDRMDRDGRDHDRDRDRERRRRSRSRDRGDRNDRDRGDRDRRERRRSRSRSRSPNRRRRGDSPSHTNTTGPSGRHEEVPMSKMSEDERMMKEVMGFGSFHTTKGKKVDGNNVGGVHVIMKRKYRQYMNRKGGFNRPLDFVA